MANILVVDDEVGIRELLSEILSDEGHAVVTAENAARARIHREQTSPDLVLLDIWMPDTDGVTLLKEWVAAGQLLSPVIMMSGHATLETAVEATRLGALDFLEKPITLSRLLTAVRDGLRHGQQQRTSALATRAAGGGAVPVARDPAARDLEAAEIVASLPGFPDSTASGGAAATPSINLDQPLRDARDQFERIYFEHLLVQENYSMTRVADRAGLERTHLYRKLKQLGVELGRGVRRVERDDGPAAVGV